MRLFFVICCKVDHNPTQNKCHCFHSKSEALHFYDIETIKTMNDKLNILLTNTLKLMMFGDEGSEVIHYHDNDMKFKYLTLFSKKIMKKKNRKNSTITAVVTS